MTGRRWSGQHNGQDDSFSCEAHDDGIQRHRRRGQLGHPVGARIGGEVEVFELPSEQGIADRAADKEDLLSGITEQPRQLHGWQIGITEELQALGDHEASGYRRGTTRPARFRRSHLRLEPWP